MLSFLRPCILHILLCTLLWTCIDVYANAIALIPNVSCFTKCAVSCFHHWRAFIVTIRGFFSHTPCTLSSESQFSDSGDNWTSKCHSILAAISRSSW